MAPPSSDPQYISNISTAIFETLEAGDPDAIWLMQAWQFLSGFWKDDLIKAWLKPIPIGRILLLDLAAELEPIYTRTQGYFGHPFLWCMIENFGGNTRMYGMTDNVIQGLQSARTKYPDQVVGIGTTPEGIDQNHINFEFLYEMSWRGMETIDRFDWMSQYIKRRYQDMDGVTLDAWKIIYKDVYNAKGIQNGGSPQGRVTNNRPYVTTKWKTLLWYKPEEFKTAFSKMLDVAHKLPKSEPLVHDLAKIASTFVEDLMPAIYTNLITAFNNKSRSMLSKHADQLIEAFDDVDQLLAADRYSLLGNWLESAKSYGDTYGDKLNLEFNARNQVTLWGPKGQISDYANKNWAGLMKGYYKERWVRFIEELFSCIDEGRPYDDNAFYPKLLEFGMQWNEDTTPYTTQPEGDIIELSKHVLEKYTRFYNANALVCQRVWADGVEWGDHLSKVGFLGDIMEQKARRRQRLMKKNQMKKQKGKRNWDFL